MIDITIKNLSKSYFSEAIFEDINIDIKKGERVGLLGENGTGKTTIFKIIFGMEKADSGDLFIRKGLKIGYLRQVPNEYEDISVRQVLLHAFKNLDELRTSMTKMEIQMTEHPEDIEKILKDYGKAQEEYEVLGGYDIDEKMSKICEGMRFDADMLKKPYKVLSGGEKTRIELGRLLLEEPDILLLDEPTNHLDIGTTEWLEEYMKTYKGSVLIISHDRYFLDRVIDRIYEIKAGSTEIYLGNYSYYLEERQIRYENQMKHYSVQQKKIKQMEEAVKRFRQWGNQSDNEDMYVKAKAMEKRIERMDKIDKPIKDTKSINLEFDADKRSGKEVVKVENYNLNIAGMTLVKDMDFHIYYKERVALIGPNGCGKSTLIKYMLKSMNELDSEIKVGASVNIGYLEQDIKFDDEEKSILALVKDEFGVSDGEVRNYLAKFKFYREEVFKKVKNLSGGEKVRLLLSILMKREINFLVLDEPTNHIDIKTKEVLEETLDSFGGTILFISHDRYLLNKLADRIYEIENQEISEYIGNYEFYKNEKEKKLAINSVAVEPTKEKVKPKSMAIKEKAKKINKYKLKEVEDNIENLETEIADLKKKIDDNPTRYTLIQELLEEVKLKEDLLDEVLAEWMEMTSE